MRPGDKDLGEKIDARLNLFHRETRALPGIRSARRREVFLEQLLDSVHRVKFVEVVAGRQISVRRADPNDELFDPVKAAILQQRRGNVEEAFWLVFLFVHFGKHATGGWRYAREVYGRLGSGSRWDWATTSQHPVEFRAWLDAHQEALRRPDVPGGFGNHRKRESLAAYSENGTGAVVESYVGWVGPPRTHQQMIAGITEQTEGDPRAAFGYLYHSMEAVRRFGRLARFDYLSMLGKLGLAHITAGSPYLSGSSGPRRGAELLFGRREPAVVLDAWVIELGETVGLGMQVLEDALCNWQKSPARYIAFRV